jgi:hypothetical protein
MATKQTPKQKASVLIAKMAKHNTKASKAKVKQFFDHTEFASAMYKALELPKLPLGDNARMHALTHGVSVLQYEVCARKSKLNDNGVMRPELAVLAIMQSLAKFDARLENVGYVRYAVNGTTLASDESNADAYKVLLYRK